MPTNMNAVRASNKLDAIKREVDTRVEASKDEDGDVNTELFRIANPDITTSMSEWLTDRTEKSEAYQAEIDDYTKGADAMARFDKIVDIGKEIKRAPLPTGNKSEGLADELFSSAEYKSLMEGDIKSMTFKTDMRLKTLFETTTGGAADTVSVESVRDGDFVPLARTRVTLLDLIPQRPTEFPVVQFDAEVLNESNVGVIAQGAAYSESRFRIDERTSAVVKVGAYIQVSEELLSDRAEMRSRIDTSLRTQMLRRIQSDIIGGAPSPASEYVGTPVANASITGFLDIATADINTIDGNAGAAAGTHINEYELIERAQEVVYRNGEADADAIVMNSQDWLDYVTLQTTTGSFVARGALAPLSDATPPAIAGLPVIFCNALPVNTVLVGAFGDHAMIRDRQQVQVRIQEAQRIPSVAVASNATTATSTVPAGRFNIYTDGRFAFYTRRGLAFCTITEFGVDA